DAPVSSHLVAPPRISGLALGFMVRPLLSLSSGGGGIEGELYASYRGQRSYFLQAEVDPVAGGFGSEGSVGVFAGRVLAGYDHWLFAMGLGLGVGRFQSHDYYYYGGSVESPEPLESHEAALSVDQY